MRTLFAGIVAGIAIFIWGALSHMLLPTGSMGLEALPNEAAVVDVLRQTVPAHGVYFIPGIDMRRQPTPEEERSWQARIKSGPVALLVYRPTGGEALAPRQLLIELLSNIAAAIVAAIVLSRTTAGYVARVAICALMGLFAWLSVNVSHWNWYSFTAAFEIAELVDQVGGGLVAGLVLGKLAPTRVANG